jgi:hypothetical protein
VTGTVEVLTEAGAATVGTAAWLGVVAAEATTRTLSTKDSPAVRAPEASPAEVAVKTAPAKAALDRPARARAARIRQVVEVRGCLTAAETCRHRKGSVVLSSVARRRRGAKAQRAGLSAKGQRSCC